jgi:hypothetical protein
MKCLIILFFKILYLNFKKIFKNKLILIIMYFKYFKYKFIKYKLNIILLIFYNIFFILLLKKTITKNYL